VVQIRIVIAKIAVRPIALLTDPLEVILIRGLS
jgi:hypothetical protein